jgi:uncharacterized SAM-binding protein YcdF (DUF218 family)
MTSRLLEVFAVRRERWTLTWTSRLLVLAIIMALAVTIVRGLHRFLAVNSPVDSKLLVVEGWMPTFAYREAAKEFMRGHYSKVIAVGILQEDGLAGGDPQEDFGTERLVRFGVPRELIVTASNAAFQRDRTFHAAMAVKEWLRKEQLWPKSINVVTVGPHARRSRLLYQKALGEDFEVGVIAIPDWRVDPAHWWWTSEGARTVISELIGYVYASLFFVASP